MTHSTAAAERAVLAAMLLDAEAAVPLATAELTAEHFHHAHHGHTFAAIVAVHKRGDQVSGVTVTAEIEASGLLEAIGGPASIADLYDAATSTAGLASHVAIVRRHHAKVTTRRAAARLLESFDQNDGRWLDQARAFNEARLTAEREMAPKGEFAHLMEQVRLARDLATSDEPVPPSLFGDRLFVAGSLAAIVGPPKLGKTALALQLMRSAALGIPWLGFNWDGPDIGVRAGMLQYEMTRGEMKLRINKLGDPMGPLGVMLELLCIPDPAPSLKTRHGLDMLEGWITQSRLGLCAVDSHTMAFQLADKAGRDEVTSALQGLAGVARRTGCLIVLVHHTKKRTGDPNHAHKHEDDDQDVGEAASGSGAFAANTDTYLALKPAPRDQVRVRFLCRHAQKPEPLVCDRNEDGWLERGTAPEDERDGRMRLVEKMLTESPQGIPAGKILDNLQSLGHNVTPQTVRRYLTSIGAMRTGPKQLSIYTHPRFHNRGQSDMGIA